MSYDISFKSSITLLVQYISAYPATAFTKRKVNLEIDSWSERTEQRETLDSGSCIKMIHIFNEMGRIYSKFLDITNIFGHK